MKIQKKDPQFWIKRKLNAPFVLVLMIIIFIETIIFFPLFKNKIPISTNLLVSFYAPWSKDIIFGWEHGIPNKPTGIDDLKIFYPQRLFTQSQFSKKTIPGWNPYNYAGNYHTGLSETAPFYPLFLLNFLVPQIQAWILLMILQPILTGVGMFLYLRKILKDEKAMIFGSVVWAFSGVILVRMVEGISVGHTLIWLPYVLYGIEAFILSTKQRYLLVTLLAFCMSILAGWFQFTFYMYVLAFGYVVIRLEKNLFRNKIILLPFVLSPLLTLFHVWPALITYFDSPRGLENATMALRGHLMPLQHSITSFISDFWGNPGIYSYIGRSEYKESMLWIGLLPVVFAIATILQRHYSRIIVFYISMVCVSLCIGVDWVIARLIISLPIPFVSTFLPNRIFTIASFSLAVLASYGFQSYFSNTQKTFSFVYFKRSVKILIFALLVIDVYLGLYFICSRILVIEALPDWLRFTVQKFEEILGSIGANPNPLKLITQMKSVFWPHVIIFVTVCSIWVFRKTPKVLIGMFFILTFVPQILFAKKYIPFSEKPFLYPQHEVFTYISAHQGITRFIDTGTVHIPPNIPLYFGLYTPNGVSSMFPKQYGDVVSYAQKKGGSDIFASRVEVSISPSRLQLATEEFYLIRLMQILGVSSIVDYENNDISVKDSKIPITIPFPLLMEKNNWRIYSFPDATPRFFWTSHFEVMEDRGEILKRLYDPLFDVSSNIILEEDPMIGNSREATGSVRLIDYSPSKISFQTNSVTSGLVYLSDTHTQSWKVTIDGMPGKMLRANYAFRAVSVPGGSHNVTMYFDETPTRYGFLVSLVIIFICGFVYSIRLLRQYKI